MSIKKPLSELDLICNQAQKAKLELRRASQSIKDDALKYGAEYILKKRTEKKKDG